MRYPGSDCKVHRTGERRRWKSCLSITLLTKNENVSSSTNAAQVQPWTSLVACTGSRPGQHTLSYRVTIPREVVPYLTVNHRYVLWPYKEQLFTKNHSRVSNWHSISFKVIKDTQKLHCRLGISATVINLYHWIFILIKALDRRYYDSSLLWSRRG